MHTCALVLAAISFLAVITGTAVSSNEERPFYGFGRAHTWIGIAAGVLTLAVAILARRKHESRWLRQLSWSALAAAAIQAMLGFRMLSEPSTAVRIAHTLVAQLFFAGIAAIAACTSRAWENAPQAAGNVQFLRRLADATAVVVFAQVGLGTLFRHGALEVGPHLIGAFVFAGFVLGLALSVIYGSECASLRLPGRAFLAIASTQAFLGMALFSLQIMDVDPAVVILMSMLHAATGALTLAATILMALLIRRIHCLPS